MAKTTPEATPEPTTENTVVEAVATIQQPLAGGSYLRNADGSLTKINEDDSK